MGMNEDLKLVGNNFSNAATALYIATFIGEILTGRPSFPSHLPHTSMIPFQRLYTPKNSAGKMAWDQCHLVGYSHCVHRYRKKLSRSPYMPRPSWRVRGCYVTVLDAHNR
jgi:hypothetical protein